MVLKVPTSLPIKCKLKISTEILYEGSRAHMTVLPDVQGTLQRNINNLLH